MNSWLLNGTLKSDEVFTLTLCEFTFQIITYYRVLKWRILELFIKTCFVVILICPVDGVLLESVF